MQFCAKRKQMALLIDQNRFQDQNDESASFSQAASLDFAGFTGKKGMR